MNTGAIGLEKCHDLIGEILTGNHHRRPANTASKLNTDPDTPSSKTSSNSTGENSPESHEKNIAPGLTSPTGVNLDIVSTSRLAQQSTIQLPSKEIVLEVQDAKHQGVASLVSSDLDCLRQGKEEVKISQNELTPHKTLEHLSLTHAYGKEDFSYPSCEHKSDGVDNLFHESVDQGLEINEPATMKPPEGDVEGIEGCDKYFHAQDLNYVNDDANEDETLCCKRGEVEERNEEVKKIMVAGETSMSQVYAPLDHSGDLKLPYCSGKTLLPPLKSTNMKSLSASIKSGPIGKQKAVKSCKDDPLMRLTVIRRDGYDVNTQGSRLFMVLFSGGRALFFKSEEAYMNDDCDAYIDELNLPKMFNRGAKRQTQYRCVVVDDGNHSKIKDMTSRNDGVAEFRSSDEGDLLYILYKKRRAQTWGCVMSLQLESNFTAQKLLSAIDSFKI